jgi:hypothetical protein
VNKTLASRRVFSFPFLEPITRAKSNTYLSVSTYDIINARICDTLVRLDVMICRGRVLFQQVRLLEAEVDHVSVESANAGARVRGREEAVVEGCVEDAVGVELDGPGEDAEASGPCVERGQRARARARQRRLCLWQRPREQRRGLAHHPARARAQHGLCCCCKDLWRVREPPVFRLRSGGGAERGRSSRVGCTSDYL